MTVHLAQLREVDVRAKVPVVHLDGGDAVGGLEVRERDRVFIGNQREQLQKEPAQAPSSHLKPKRCHAVGFTSSDQSQPRFAG